MSYRQAQAIKAMIERTGQPMLPIATEQTYAHVTALGKLMPGLEGFDKAKCMEHSEHLLSAYPQDMDAIDATPEFIVALAALLSEAILSYGATFFPPKY